MIDAFYLLDTGYCLASEAHLIRGGARQSIHCHALAALLHHTREGWLLFDTGYAQPLTTATERLPYRLYRWLLPAHSLPEQSVAAQLTRYGLTASDIRHIVVSHFHPDHISGLSDFPEAAFVCDRAGWEAVASIKGIAALRRGILPSLIPEDFAARARFCEFVGPTLPEVGETCDLFGDASLLLVRLPGHAQGQMGLFVPETPRGPVFLVADAAYLTRGLRDNIPFAPTTNWVSDNSAAARETVQRLHTFHQARPDVILLPTHCPDAFARVEAWGNN